MNPNCIIRPYRSTDRAQVRRLACETALMGEPCDAFFDGREVMSDALTRYYTDYEPRSSFVAECDGRVTGYVIGSVDVKNAGSKFVGKILGPLVWRAVVTGALFKGRNLKFFSGLFLSVIRGEFMEPSFSAQYPAELHINIDRGYRGHGLGHRLIETYEQYLQGEGISGVHLATYSDGAAEFFKKQGFEVLYEAKRSYLRRFIGRDVNLYIFGKSLLKTQPIVDAQPNGRGLRHADY